MALPKLYEQITWVNDTTPALNEDNLNAMSQALDDIDDRVIDLAGTIMEDVPQIIEDMATIEAGLETVGQAVTDAQTAASDADADRLVSEGYAVGKQNGVDVPSTSPYYHNNAKYYSQVAPPTAAVHVSYDHSQSHLAATNVQGAVDELKEALTDEVETRSALGAKNLFAKLFTNGSHNGITYTANDDGTVSYSGQINASTYSTKDSSVFTLPAGSYILSKNPVPAAGSATHRSVLSLIQVGVSAPILQLTDKDEGTFTLNSSTSVVVRIVFNGYGESYSGTFYPMIRLATDSDPTYQPYAMTNKELTADKADKSDLASISITGTTNNTGLKIPIGRYFYLNGALVRAKTDIANGATLTANTNYEAVTAGLLNSGLLKIKAAEGIIIDSITIPAGGSGEVKINGSNISYSALGVPQGSIQAVFFEWSTGHVCVPNQCYVSGDSSIGLTLYNPTSNSVTVSKVDLRVLYI